MLHFDTSFTLYSCILLSLLLSFKIVFVVTRHSVCISNVSLRHSHCLPGQFVNTVEVVVNMSS